MLGIGSIAKKIKYRSCERLVTYTGNEITFSDAAIKAGPLSIDLGTFSKNIKEIVKVPELLIALDTHQYFFCCQASDLKDDNPLKDECIRIRLITISSITTLHTLLCIPKPDKQMKTEINKWIINTTKLSNYCIEQLKPRKNKTQTKNIEKIDQLLNNNENEPKKSQKDQIQALMAEQGINVDEMNEAVQILKE